MTKYLIVNSDDFGISEGVSRGIIEAHLKGIVTSTSTMANMPAAAEAIKAAHQQAPKLGLGLHLVLSYGNPVSAPETVPSLVNEDGKFPQNYQGLMEKLADYRQEDIEREYRAQFERFVELAGHKPDHLDSHHDSSYFHPLSFEAMLKLAQEHDLAIRRPSWLVVDNLGHLPINADGKLKDRLLAIYEAYKTVKTTEHITEGTFFWDRRSRLEPLRQALETVREGYTELVCHVGYGAGLEEDYHEQREDELAAFVNPEIVTYVKENFELVTFADLP